ncbi:hypothetical protein [Natribacillus halophilus]|uniref:Uncharacterized protein n=1 Tax=Natribacillus halophilus TaxID=549003 RepID=A0A1G8QCX6_9BACI|nr:hypothetical protein [Natribacillus halophilus]SDJ02557.1 hypothetical protein SAMN04488123_11184 [Natribacillus halophilus]
MGSLLGTLMSFVFLFVVFLLLLYFVLRWFNQMVDTRKYLRVNLLTIVVMCMVIVMGFLKNFYSITFMLIIPLSINVFCVRNVMLYYRGRKF